MRRSGRFISRQEIVYVLESGRHEASRDRFDLLHQEWNYALRGKTVDGRELRVIVSFEKGELVIITAIDLDNEK